jgi:hypothetical protein
MVPVRVLAMNYNGQKLDTNSARYIELLKDLETDETTSCDSYPASLLASAPAPLAPSEPPQIHAASPTVDVDPGDGCEALDCFYRELYATGDGRPARHDQQAAVAAGVRLMRRRAF